MSTEIPGPAPLVARLPLIALGGPVAAASVALAIAVLMPGSDAARSLAAALLLFPAMTGGACAAVICEDLRKGWLTAGLSGLLSSVAIWWTVS